MAQSLVQQTGKFIVVEGLEGAGKTSAIAVICDVLQNAGIEFITTREPGGTAMSEAIRDCVKHDWQGEQVLAETELMLMYGARIQLIHNVIQPHLDKGIWVIGDRHDLSTRAYQGGGGELSKDIIEPLRKLALKGFKPDLTLYLDVTPLVGLERARGRGQLDRIEQNDIGFFERTRNVYLEAAAEDNTILTVDAQQDINLVQQDIQQLIKEYI